MLNLSGKDAFILMKPAIKFLKCQQIEKADFSEMDNFSDEQADMLATFLKVEAPSKYFTKRNNKKINLDLSSAQKSLKTELSMKLNQSMIQNDLLQSFLMQNSFANTH